MKLNHAFISLVALALPLAFNTSCQPHPEASPQSKPAPTNAEPVKMSCCSEDAPKSTAGLPDTSIYHMESKWTDQAGVEHTLRDFRGKVTVAAMIFTNCEFACPRMLVDLKAIEHELPKNLLEEVHWLLLSMDSDRDLPQVLKAYAVANDLDTSRWTLLHGDESAVREMGATLGVRYKKDPRGNFSHSNRITVLDLEGRISHQQDGLGADPKPTIAAIIAQVNQL